MASNEGAGLGAEIEDALPAAARSVNTRLPLSNVRADREEGSDVPACQAGDCLRVSIILMT